MPERAIQLEDPLQFREVVRTRCLKSLGDYAETAPHGERRREEEDNEAKREY